jgi:hypothetical protein
MNWDEDIGPRYEIMAGVIEVGEEAPCTTLPRIEPSKSVTTTSQKAVIPF